MSSLLEVIVTCDSNNTLWTCSVWDPHTGTSLMTYRGGGTSEPKTLSFIGKDYIATVEKTKPVLHVWPLNSHQTVQGIRFILPGKSSTLTFSQDGQYCIAGIEEKIYVWQISSGSLLTIINRHYQKVTVLKFTSDGRYFISAAEDGMVMVWSLATVTLHPEVELVTQRHAGQHDPIYIFSDHSLPVTDLCISKTGMSGRLCTVSSDRTCKIYDLSSGELLLNLVFDVPLSSVVLDVLELNIFIGTNEGNIHSVSLSNPPRNRDLLVSTDANNSTFSGHSKTVTCLSVSLDGETLMSGSNDERVILWHIKSKQSVRTIPHKGPVTNAFFSINYPTIYNQDFSPSIILHSLERSLERDSDDLLEIEVLVKKKIDFWPKEVTRQLESVADTKEIESEFKLKEQAMNQELETLKNINSSLYSFAIKNVMNAALNTNNNHSTKSKKKKNKK